jgi:hypothetical protein
MKYSYIRESPWYNKKLKCTGCQTYKNKQSINVYSTINTIFSEYW